MSSLPPIRREVLVDADKAIAFDVFTSGIGRWWPLELHGVFGAQSSVSFRDGMFIEESATGEQAVWGTVTRWEPSDVVAFTWHPGADSDEASFIEVTFTEAGAQTLVALEHSGWEVYDDPDAAREGYGEGWIEVLSLFAGSAADA